MPLPQVSATVDKPKSISPTSAATFCDSAHGKVEGGTEGKQGGSGGANFHDNKCLRGPCGDGRAEVSEVVKRPSAFATPLSVRFNFA